MAIPPLGILVSHVADLEQPSMHEYLRLVEYSLYRMFQILDLPQHEFIVKQNRTHVGLQQDLEHQLHSSKDQLLVQKA